MQIKLLELTLSNFKGISNFKLTCQSNDIEVHGDNATGKTSVYDGFLWLLFDKDSEGKKDFEIKALDINNNPIHKLEHTVEARLCIDGTTTTFKKVYKENWVKKRGSIEPELSGHTTDYWIDDVPTKKKDYDSYINNLIDETTFKLLTDVRCFTEKINWKERRIILTSIAADHMDPVVLPTTLIDLIGNKSLDDFKKIIAEKKKKLKKELEAIPIRIDELNKNLPDIQGIDFEGLKKHIKIAETNLENLNNEGKQIIEHNNKFFDLKSHLRQKESLKRDLEERLSKDANKDYEQALKDKFTIETDINNHQSKLKKLNELSSSTENHIKSLNNNLCELGNDWVSKRNEQFNGSTTCPTCRQEFPEAEIDKIKSEFESNKKLSLDNIVLSGNTLKNKKEALDNELQIILKEIDATIQYITENNLKLQEIETILNQDRATVNFSASKTWTSLESEINDLNIQITDFKELNLINLDTKKNNLKSDILRHSETLSKRTQFDLAMDRQKELLKEETSLANSLNELEKQEFQIQEFTMKKINALESTVNGMFKNVKFKMFETQLNGGVNEICEILIKGVPYSSANYAGRINAGLDIINALSKEYDILAPVFVDNAESVTKVVQLEQQQILLIKDENYTQLAIVENVKNMKEAIAI